MAAATSSGVAGRPTGKPRARSAYRAPAGASIAARRASIVSHIGVSTSPGQTQLTRMPGAHAAAADRVRLITAAFDAAYGASQGAARLPAAEATLTIRAGAGAARSAGSAATIQRYVPNTFTSCARIQSVSLKASNASTTTTP